MVRILVENVILMVLALGLVFAAVQHFNPPPVPLLIHADYQRCATIPNGPLATIKRPLGVKSAFSGVS